MKGHVLHRNPFVKRQTNYSAWANGLARNLSLNIQLITGIIDPINSTGTKADTGWEIPVSSQKGVCIHAVFNFVIN